MKFVVVWLMAGLAIGCCVVARPILGQREESAGKNQVSAIRWQFDTHG
jgi:hypothetical protein